MFLGQAAAATIIVVADRCCFSIDRRSVGFVPWQFLATCLLLSDKKLRYIVIEMGSIENRDKVESKIDGKVNVLY